MNPVMKALIWLHRYLGVAVGLVMTLWCLSGVVMMYVSFPDLTEAERLRGLAPLSLGSVGAVAAADDPVKALTVETVAGRPVVRATLGDRKAQAFDLASGSALARMDAPAALRVARDYGVGHGLAGMPRLVEQLQRDQWTVYGGLRRYRPLYRIAFDDPARTEVYVASTTGEVVQDTTRRERFWSWLGAVPHWLYPTLLRENTALWSQVVIWLSVIGVFLTITGLVIGIVRFRKRPSGRWVPYRGLMEWHHWTGLIGGVLALTWVLSGLLSMNPWGLLEGDGAGGEVRAALSGPAPTWGRVQATLRMLGRDLPDGTVALRLSPLGGRLFLTAVDAAGDEHRLDETGAPVPLARAELQTAVQALGARAAGSLEMLTAEDAYYYSHHDAARLPVWRTVDGVQRLYIDPDNGQLLKRVDTQARAYRWLHYGLHRFDFAGLRARPVWDVVVIPLLAMTALVCGIGAWLGFRRIARDLGLDRRRPGGVGSIRKAAARS